MLRQQVKPTHRIHGIFEGKDWAANSKTINQGYELQLMIERSYPRLRKDVVSASYCLLQYITEKCSWYVRGETWADVQALLPRVKACFQ